MPARRFTDEQELEICRRYLAGESSPALAAVFGGTTGAIAQALRRGGIKPRSRGDANRRFTDEQEQEICGRYMSGESSCALSKQFDCTRGVILSALRRNGVDSRSKSAAQMMFSPSEEAEICSRYSAGENTVTIGRSLRTGPATINKILERNGVSRRTQKQAKGGLSDEAVAEVCARYIKGESSLSLSKAFAVSKTAVLKALQDSGVKVRDAVESHGGPPRELEVLICDRYIQGEGTVAIGQSLGYRDAVIRRVLESRRINRRTSKVLSDEQELELCARYLGGECAPQLAIAYGVNTTTPYNVLKRHGIEERHAHSPAGDSIRNLLDGEMRAIESVSEFYVYELANHAGYCKPGIDSTGTRADAEYGEQLLSIYGVRRDVWLLEQAVLNEARAHQNCPQELVDRRWAGWTEVRKMPADDLCGIAIDLHEQLLELGPWEFAARYVPMTATQRAICQQRALVPVAA